MKLKINLKKFQDKLIKKRLIFLKKVKKMVNLYGSIKPKEISNLIKEKTNVEVIPSQVVLKNELNKIGLFNVDLNFHSEVKAQIFIKIDKVQTK